MSKQKWINLGTLNNRKYEIIEKSVKPSKPIRSLPKVILEPYENKVNRWLDRKIDDDKVESVYDVGDHCMSKFKKPYKVRFDEYYYQDDTDMKSSATNTIEVINELKRNDELVDNDYYYRLDFYVERYDNEQILILPSSNRHFANELLKRLIDYSIDNKFNYKIYDEETEEIYEMNLMDSSIKDLFYQFCYENTYKNMSF